MRKSSFLRFFLSLVIILPAIHFASSILSPSAFATDSTLTMSTSDTTFNITPSSSGNFATSTTPATISVTTDNYTGYRLTLASSADASTALTNIADSTKSISSISSTISQSEFISNSNYTNMWGISPSKLNSQDNSNYLPAPTAAITIDQTSSANSTANVYTIYPAAKVNYGIEAGSYTATLIAQVVINLATYNITYVDSSNSATNMPANQSGSTSDPSLSFSSSIPARGTSYTFQGWCDGTVTSQDTPTPACSGTTYQPGTTINIEQTSNNSLTLNAIWKKNMFTINFVANNASYGTFSVTSLSKAYGTLLPATGTTTTSIAIDGTTINTTPANGYILNNWTHGCGSTLTEDCTIVAHFAGPYMQNFSCGALGSGGTMNLYDRRDNNIYLIAKLPDGNCWMLDNLRLGGASPIALTTADTNIASDWTLPASGAWTSSAQNSLTEAYISASYKDNIASTAYGSGSGKVGVFYNFCAASAGTICVSNNQNNASYDVCPRGWRLPTGGAYGEIKNLYTIYGYDKSTFQVALSISYAGDFSSGIRHNGAGFWSSTLYGAGMMCDFNSRRMMSYGYDPENSGYTTRVVGLSIRCMSQ